MTLWDILRFKDQEASSSDLASAINELDQGIRQTDEDLLHAEEALNESQRQALVTGKEPPNLTTLVSRVATLKDRRRHAEATRAELVAKIREALPRERRAKLKELQREERELRLLQQEARTGLLASFGQLLVVFEEVEGYPAKRLLAPHASLDFLAVYKRKFSAELAQAVEEFRRDRPEGVGAKLKRNEREQRKLQIEVSEDDVTALVQAAQTATS